MKVLLVVPITWPFLVLYLMVRCWKVTVPLMLVGLMYWLVLASPWVGYPVLALTVIITVWQLHLRQSSPVRQEDPEWTSAPR